MNRWRLALAGTLLLALATAAGAAPAVHLVFKDGRVTLTAHGATAAQILAEWARVGGTRIVNGDRVSSPPLTLDLKDVPETDALDVVLRNAAGFIATARPPGLAAAASLSSVEHVTVLAARSPAVPSPAASPSSMPTPTPTEGTSPAPTPPQPPIFDASGARRIIGLDGQPIPDDQEGAPPPPPEASPR